LFAPLPPDEEKAVKVALTELKDFPADVLAVLATAGKRTLQDIIDLDPDDIAKIEGMTPELAEKLNGFLNELTEDGDEETAPEAPAQATAETPAEAPAAEGEAPAAEGEAPAAEGEAPAAEGEAPAAEGT
jgi:hypothetical protein